MFSNILSAEQRGYRTSLRRHEGISEGESLGMSLVGWVVIPVLMVRPRLLLP